MGAAIVSFAKHVRRSSHVDDDSSRLFSFTIRYPPRVDVNVRERPLRVSRCSSVGLPSIQQNRSAAGALNPPEGQSMKKRVLVAIAVAVPLAFGTSRLMAQGN